MKIAIVAENMKTRVSKLWNFFFNNRNMQEIEETQEPKTHIFRSVAKGEIE